MAAYPKNKFWFAFFAIFVLLGFSSVSQFVSGITQAEVKAICSPTLNPSFCSKFLNSDPRFEKLDLSGVAKISINYAQRNAIDTKNQLQSVANSTSDDRVKKHYVACLRHYDMTLDSFVVALEDLEVKKDYYGVNIEIEVASGTAGQCKSEELIDVKPDPKLLKKIDVLRNVCDLVMSISIILQKD